MPCVAALAIAGCSAAPDGAALHDPYEESNRARHDANTALFARLPGDPDSGRAPGTLSRRVGNMAENLGHPRRVVNDLLQLRFASAVENGYRFVVNSTIGVGGVFDPAARIGAPGRATDFGETLYVWGVPEGAYQELPILGPSTERRTAGRVVDLFLDPLGEVLTPRERNLARAVRISGGVLGREPDPDLAIPADADSYTRARLNYLQTRRAQLGDDSHAALLSGESP